MSVAVEPIRTANVFMVSPHLEQPDRANGCLDEQPRWRSAQVSDRRVESSSLLPGDRAFGELRGSTGQVVEADAARDEHPAEERRYPTEPVE